MWKKKHFLSVITCYIIIINFQQILIKMSDSAELILKVKNGFWHTQNIDYFKYFKSSKRLKLYFFTGLYWSSTTPSPGWHVHLPPKTASPACPSTWLYWSKCTTPSWTCFSFLDSRGLTLYLHFLCAYASSFWAPESTRALLLFWIDFKSIDRWCWIDLVVFYSLFYRTKEKETL